jgi:hypothetical protein
LSYVNIIINMAYNDIIKSHKIVLKDKIVLSFRNQF